jgi:hypothetical protein
MTVRTITTLPRAVSKSVTEPFASQTCDQNSTYRIHRTAHIKISAVGTTKASLTYLMLSFCHTFLAVNDNISVQ